MAKDISKRKQEQLYLYQTNEWKILDPTLKLLELTNEFSKVSGDKFFFFFSFWPPHDMWSSWARDQIQAAGEARLDPQLTALRQGSNPRLSAPKMPLIPLCHSGNSNTK